jgi:hypothetical protein
MASTTLTIQSPAISGTTVSGKTAVASSETLTIQASTAQGAIDFKSLKVRIENTSTTASVSLSLGAGTEYGGVGIGAATVSIGTATTVIVGGQTLEGTRFLTSGNTIVFTQTGTGPTSWEAYQTPRALE